jgi:curved DNA-binding protein
MKDYYQILGITPDCGEEELRKSYRRLAMRYHPDRNPDDPEAEERFKEIAEAYGVLTDPVKRREYERCRAGGSNYGDGGFSYSQDDILRDLFRDPRFQALFSGLLREFQRSGFRHSSQFVKNSFFGGKAGIVLGGIFLFGSLAAPLLSRVAQKTLTNKGPLLHSLGHRVGKLLRQMGRKTGNRPTPPIPPEELDITYHTPLTADELARGKTLRIMVYAESGEQTLKVQVPPGSKGGQLLRLRGQGRPGPLARGDLYLQLVEKES